MDTAGTPDPNKSTNRTKTWLVAGIICLFLLAAASSIDASLVYILLGACTFCFFMALRDWITHRKKDPYTQTRTNYQQQQRPREPEPKEENDSFSDNLKEAFRQKEKNKPKPPTPMSEQTRKELKTMVRIFAGIGIMIFVVVIFVIAFGDDDYDGEVQYYKDQGSRFIDMGEYDSALVNYRRVLRIQPENIEARMGYGKALYFKEKYDSAIITFNAILEEEPQYPEARLFRGRTFYYQKDYERALAEAKAMLEETPNYNEANLLAGDIYYSQGLFDDAIAYYQPAYDNGARGSFLCWAMAYIYDDKKRDLARAIPLYKEALEYDDTTVEIYDRLGVITQEPEAGRYRTKAAELRQSK